MAKLPPLLQKTIAGLLPKAAARPAVAVKGVPAATGLRTWLPLIIAIIIGIFSLVAVVIWALIAMERGQVSATQTPAAPAIVAQPITNSTDIAPTINAPTDSASIAPTEVPAALPMIADGATTTGIAVDNNSHAPVTATSLTVQRVTLITAPDPAVTEDTATGPLPRVGEDGRKPWQVYSRPFIASKKPRIAIVITGLGFSAVQTAAAIDNLPQEVTLAFDVQSARLGAWLFRGRQVGHEALIALPMEPFDYPRSDPGPGTLLTNLTVSENLLRLQDHLRKTSGYIGITTQTGSQFTTVPQAVEPVLRELNRRGVLFFDAKPAPMSVAGEVARNLGMPLAEMDLRLDQEMTAAAIDQALLQLVQKAQQAGRAVGVARASPLVFERINRWAQKLPQQGMVLVPLSAVVE
jgi:uncharacterized protein